MKPILYLDVDGVLNGMTGEANKDLPWALCRIERADEFFRWARSHFHIKFLSAWCGNGLMSERTIKGLTWLLRANPLEIASCEAVLWFDVNNKAIGIGRDLDGEDKEWYWMDDDRVFKEQEWLFEHGVSDRFIHVDNFDNHSPGLMDGWETLKRKIGLDNGD